MNQKKLASTVVTVGVLASSVAGCSEKSRPLNERVFTDVICMKVYTSGGSGSNCGTVLSASSADLEKCIPQNPASPISSLQELARYCPSVASRITANNNSSGESTPSPGTDTTNAAEVASVPERMSDLGDTVKAVGLGIIGLVAVTILGFWIRARRDRQNRTAQRAHAAEHGWHS
ncbi:hypothetical protein SAMN04489765_3825 [Tsukamurella pulmonis]|uniref:Uncharacterized protein n=1 Tax=Tsukamurella pulmonis TaxID=47312 RepID=A0A1H1H580_9ACTN|nr:hypothetical protein [Tsukamurella pulmonis]SDR20574.1 hypothetical protein SAMN04489765_3825 [Tsukamurella pulmonis]SUP15921.1 Uncharacterised protein [Tsukamurella pulmonis]